MIRNKNLDKISRNTEYCDSFNLGPQSIFLDIGSGIGRPVINAAFAADCLSIGIEVVPSRVQGSYLLMN